MNRREWVLYGQKELEEAQIENASGDAWYLFSECFHISREDYLFGMTDEINDKEAEERYKELIQKRKEHVPLQYILGTQEFMGYTFKVTPDVLIPRADTETVLEEVLLKVPQTLKESENFGFMHWFRLYCDQSGIDFKARSLCWNGY